MKRVGLITLILILAPLFSFSQSQEVKEYHDNGNLKSLYQSDGDEVYYIIYHENGNLKEKGVFSKEDRHGTFRSYYESGEKRLLVKFMNNTREGEWTMWNKDGDVIGSASFEKGELLSGSIWDGEGALITTAE